MNLYTVECLMMIPTFIGISATALSYFTSASEGRTAQYLPLGGGALIALPLVYFVFNPTIGINHDAVLFMLFACIILAFARVVYVFAVQAPERAIRKQIDHEYKLEIEKESE